MEGKSFSCPWENAGSANQKPVFLQKAVHVLIKIKREVIGLPPLNTNRMFTS